MSDAIPVGIDLGTTNSAVAWVDKSGRSMIVRNAEGDLLTPSVVLFDDAEVVVGKEARTAAPVHPENVAECVKRDMGSPVYGRPIRGQYMPPEVIQACILRKLRADLVASVGPEASVVITVPAYFDEPRRKGTADAGEMAGLRVLDIVNEPTAAALAFGEIHGYLSPTGGASEEMTVLVYDLGGGTFDVTLLTLQPGDVRTLATDGDVQLGGHDWDLRLLDHVADSFQEAHGADPRDDPRAATRLYREVIEAKHTLSARGRATIRVEHAGMSVPVQVTRDEFESLTAGLLERTAYTTRQLVKTANVPWSQVARVLLVGGATRMPMVRQMLQQLSGREPDQTVNPDEAVARGAALYASHLLAERTGEGPGSSFQVTNVNSHSLGVEGIEQETLRKTNVVLIPRNSPLPARFTERFMTKRVGQQSIVIQVLEGESTQPDECTLIGRTVIRDLPPGLPMGWPIDVTFEYGANGRLKVHGTVPGTHREVELRIEREVGMTGEGVSRWQPTISAAPGFDAFEAMLDEVLSMKEPSGQTAPSDPGESGRGRAEAGAAPPAREVPESGAASAPVSQPTAMYDRPPAPAPAPSPPPVPGEREAPPTKAAAGPPPVRTQPPKTATGNEPIEKTDPGEAEEATPGARKPVPRWLIQWIGLVISAILGLGLGYLIVSWLFPGSGILNLW
jgi:molecular chaperone DnaK